MSVKHSFHEPVLTERDRKFLGLLGERIDKMPDTEAKKGEGSSILVKASEKGRDINYSLSSPGLLDEDALFLGEAKATIERLRSMIWKLS